MPHLLIFVQFTSTDNHVHTEWCVCWCSQA